MNSFSIYNYSALIFAISFLVTNPIYLDNIFAEDQTISNHNERDITYVAKFVCGSIVDRTGPLRPGHYNTDISIANKQLSPVSFFGQHL